MFGHFIFRGAHTYIEYIFLWLYSFLLCLIHYLYMYVYIALFVRVFVLFFGRCTFAGCSGSMILGLVADETVSGTIHPSTDVTLETLWYVVVCVSHVTLQRPCPRKPFVAERTVGRPVLRPAPICSRSVCNHNTGGLR